MDNMIELRNDINSAFNRVTKEMNEMRSDNFQKDLRVAQRGRYDELYRILQHTKQSMLALDRLGYGSRD